jgi:hypothetical protein
MREEIKRWAEEVQASSLYHDPEKRDFFPRRPGNSGSIRRRRRRSSGWKSTIEPLTPASDVSYREAKRGSASPKDDGNGSRKALDDARERLTAESSAGKGALSYQRVEDNAFHVVDLRS